MANNKEKDDLQGTIHITAHEIAHTYFPFYVGTNEQQNGWMDEGIITFVHELAIDELLEEGDFVPFASLARKYGQYAARLTVETPIMEACQKTGDAYIFANYGKSSISFYLLYDYLGEEGFFEAVREFANRWKGKHPMPFDLFFTFNEVAGEDLAWFWEPWFFELGYADVGIGRIEENNESTVVHIEKYGNCPVPVSLKVIYKDGEEASLKASMDTWKHGIRATSFEIPKGNIQEVVVNELYPDAYRENNLWVAHHEIDPVILQSYAGDFGPRHIIFDDGNLFYQREGGAKMRMIPVNDRYFRFEEIDYFRIKMIMDQGEVVALEGNYTDGRKDRDERSK